MDTNEKMKEVAGIQIPESLNKNGFDTAKLEKKTQVWNEDRIALARGVIQQYFVKTHAVNERRTSYGLKDDVERIMGQYLSCGELTVAMIAEGFTVHRHECSHNCYFNVSQSGINTIQRHGKKILAATPKNENAPIPV